MLSFMAVATTDGDTSLHSPVFVVGMIAAAFGAAGDEHDAVKRASPIAATTYRPKEQIRTARRLHTGSDVSASRWGAICPSLSALFRT